MRTRLRRNSLPWLSRASPQLTNALPFTSCATHCKKTRVAGHSICSERFNMPNANRGRPKSTRAEGFKRLVAPARLRLAIASLDVGSGGAPEKEHYRAERRTETQAPAARDSAPQPCPHRSALLRCRCRSPSRHHHRRMWFPRTREQRSTMRLPECPNSMRSAIEFLPSHSSSATHDHSSLDRHCLTFHPNRFPCWTRMRCDDPPLPICSFHQKKFDHSRCRKRYLLPRIQRLPYRAPAGHSWL